MTTVVPQCFDARLFVFPPLWFLCTVHRPLSGIALCFLAVPAKRSEWVIYEGGLPGRVATRELSDPFGLNYVLEVVADRFTAGSCSVMFVPLQEKLLSW